MRLLRAQERGTRGFRVNIQGAEKLRRNLVNHSVPEEPDEGGLDTDEEEERGRSLAANTWPPCRTILQRRPRPHNYLGLWGSGLCIPCLLKKLIID